MSHTPGPWYWRKTLLPDSRDDGRWYHRWRLGHRSGLRVGMMDQISHADAHLIEAAPDYHAIAEDELPELLLLAAHDLAIKGDRAVCFELRRFARRLTDARLKANGGITPDAR
jgi:hypothetical protein